MQESNHLRSIHFLLFIEYNRKLLLLHLGTREMAFVHAISSAGVAHALTRACSSGELENCGCDRSLRGMSPEGFQVREF